MAAGNPIPGDPLDLPATARRVHAAARAANLPEGARNRALTFATNTPAPAEWQRFLSTALALLGAGLLLAGAVCFVAYNWDRIGRFGKFALIELAITACALVAWRRLSKMSGRIALFAAAVLVGPLLAIYGQTYQTGADPYGLFLTWMLLIIPWAVAARLSALWILVLGLADLTVVLFSTQVLAPSDKDMLYPALVIAALHVIALATWEWQIRRAGPWLEDVWAPRAVIASGFVAVWIPAAAFAVADSDAGLPGRLGVIGLAAAVAGSFYYFRNVKRDRFLITAAAASGMVWITVAVGRLILEELHLDVFGFFIMAAFVVWQITMGVKWYRATNRAT